MQETERAERILTDYLRKAEASPTEDGDLEAKAASMAKGVVNLLSMRTTGADVVILDGTPIVRVRMRSRSGKRTVTAGMDAFAQLVDPVLNEMPRGLVFGAVLALREELREQADLLQAGVSEAARKLTSDPEYVEGVKRTMANLTAQRVKKERENLVTVMSALLASGWTREMLMSAVDISTCASVMHG